MTFIIAIQLNDSIIVAADNNKVVVENSDELRFRSIHATKIRMWENGIITGAGEDIVIHRAVELFKSIANQNLDKLPLCLNVSREIRELEIGSKHDQVENTKLLHSSYSEKGAQLYITQRFESSQPYIMSTVESMEIIVWLFDPNIEKIRYDLQQLQQNLRDFTTFSTQIEWVHYYLRYLCPIFKKQSRQDSWMSQSFDFFFQTKEDYLIGHIPNTQISDLDIEFKEIIPASVSI